VIDALAEDSSAVSLAQLSAKLKLHKSTVHRLVMVLERHRLLERQPETGRYRLGLKLFELGSRAIAGMDLRERARPHLQRVMYETDETVHLCVLDEGEVLYVDKMEPQRSVRMASSVGRRAPVHCTSVGKAILAELPPADVEAIVRAHGLRPLTRHTVRTPAELTAELTTVRSRGYAIDDEENEEGVRCVGAAILDSTGTAIAAISVSGPSFRITKDKVPIVSRSVTAAAQAVSSQLGYRPRIQATGSSGS
jgi:DNA-binding IclR family transcriptional regulator